MAAIGLQDTPIANDRKKILILTPVVEVVVIVDPFALFLLVVVPFILPCSSRERRPTTPDNECTSQRWLF